MRRLSAVATGRPDGVPTLVPPRVLGGQEERFADAVVLAAGSSTRMGGPDKIFMEVGGLPLIAWTVRSVALASNVRRIILVARADCLETLARQPWLQDVGATLVPGGARRQDSVAAGVEAADGEVVLIHDGARPLVTPELFDRVAVAARVNGAAVPVVAVPESMRRIVDGRVVGIVDRTDLYRSQTPHGARRELLLEAYARQDPRGPETFVDETTLVQSTGIVVSTVPGEPWNLKVTLRGDEQLARARTGGAQPRPSRFPRWGETRVR
jgi:2-C-methyl-D-erythritol 4-phosphate cytidylyltransferase